MKYTIQYPMNPGFDPRFLDPEQMIRFATTAEALGFDAIAFTEHPAPSAKWLAGGGHESLDPLTVLSFVAASTTRLRLLTYLLVLPYRNPFLAAKQATTVDVVSGGRLTLAVGTGYLRSEFLALGVEFEERNALFDEALEVLVGIWTHDEFAYEGTHFTARGQTQFPRPVQQPHPPLWFGGNSRKARRRTAKIGAGWTPLLIEEGPMTQTTRTPALATPEALRAAIAELHEFAQEEGRDPAVLDVQIESKDLAMTGDLTWVRDKVATIEDAGATWVVAEPPNEDIDVAFEAMHAYAEQVIAVKS